MAATIHAMKDLDPQAAEEPTTDDGWLVRRAPADVPAESKAMPAAPRRKGASDVDQLAESIFVAVKDYLDRRLEKEHERSLNHPKSVALLAEVAALQSEVVTLKAKVRVLTELVDRTTFKAERALSLIGSSRP